MITVPFRGTPGFFTGTAGTSALVPGWMPVAVNGHPYMIDPANYRRDTVEILRQQADQSDEPGESSLNPRGLWRRGQESWHHGAGQRFLDGKESDRARFRTSKGIDPWTEGQLSLLPHVDQKRASVNTNLRILPVGGYLYVADGQGLHHSADPTVDTPTWTSADIHAGQAAQTVNSIATDGYNVWAALGASGLHRTVRAATASTADVPAQACTLVGYALGRLLIANANVLYEVTSPISAPAAVAIHTHQNTDFVWSVIAPGRNVIYAAGNSGGNAEVYRIGINPDTTLAPPIFATYLPDGEEIHAIQFYAGGVILGTGKGLRMAMADGSGNLDYGPLVTATSPVRCLEPQDRWVWYGLTNYDATSTGLGRADLGFFTGTLTPAWASDLMRTGQGDVLSVATYSDKRYFSVSGDGVYGEMTDRVASATLETGAIRFGTTESKLARSVNLRHHLLDGAVAVSVKFDEGDWESLGTSGVADTSGPDGPFSARDREAETAELRFTLTRDAVVTAGPEVVRWTFKALPVPRREESFTLPIIMKTWVDSMAGDGQKVFVDVPAEIAWLKDIEQSGRIVTLQIGEDSWSVIIDQSSHRGESWSDSGGGYRPYLEGLYVVMAQTVSS